MTQVLAYELPKDALLFSTAIPRPLKHLDLLSISDTALAISALKQANIEWGLALASDEIEYLVQHFMNPSNGESPRNPTDAELMMFAQVNSEHCRHKIFKCSWDIDKQAKPYSLFDMIRHTYNQNPELILSAYSDNAAVLQGFPGSQFIINPQSGFKYEIQKERIDSLIKVETHNHPTAVSPFPGAATGSGGEIRDEGNYFNYFF